MAAPFYCVGVFLPIMVMGMAVRQHFLQTYTGRARAIGSWGAGAAAILSATVFIGQIVGKCDEGGWIRLITMSTLFISAHLLLLSPLGHRTPEQIRCIVRDKARINSAMGSIVEWQSVKMQQYRHSNLVAISQFWSCFGVIRPVRYDPPPPSGDYDHALHLDHPDAPSFLDQYIHINKPIEPRLGGASIQTEPPKDETL